MPTRIPQNECLRERGAALVIVLSFLLIITAMVVAFLLTVSSEVKNSKAHSDIDRARQIAKSAAELAIARVRAATTGQVDPENPARGRLAWASQPGMIRTYREDGQPGDYFRLYSAESATIPGASFTVAGELPPGDWQAKAGMYVDLNAPVMVGGSPQFPVVDPRAASGNPATSVAGFNYSSFAGAVTPSSDPAAQRVPMPVRWIYLLEDGRFAIPESEAGGVVTFRDAPPESVLPSKNNPIVGRLAFWADDETAKVNINTASEGTAFDIPHYTGAPDMALSMMQPVIGEFQRYPGHPAMTSLSAVLGPWLPSPNEISLSYTRTENAPFVSAGSGFTELSQRIDRYLKLTPRYRFGGSAGGTVPTSQNAVTGAVTPLAPKTDRLYSSLDELLYDPARDANDPGITREILERTRFFLTAGGRAPEVNLFGLPRVAVWPISATDDATHRTAQDKLIARAATLGTPGEVGAQPFYFQRKNAKSTTEDYSGIPRNPQLYGMLHTLTGERIPGFGGRFSDKYGTGGRDQILTESFDYIRSTNLNDPNLSAAGMYSDPYDPWSQPYDSNKAPGLVVPIKIGTTKGSGRFPVIDQAFLIFYTPEMPSIPAPGTDPNLTETKVRAALAFNFFHPMQGFMPVFTNVQLEVSASDTFAVEAVDNPDPAKKASLVSGNSQDLFNFFADGGTVTQWANHNERLFEGNRNFGGNHGHAALSKHAMDESNPKKRFVLVSRDIPVLRGNPAEARWNFIGGTFNVRLLSADGEEVQTYEFDFPGAFNLHFPTPIAQEVENAPGVYWPPRIERKAWDFKKFARNNVQKSNGDYIPSLFSDTDYDPSKPGNWNQKFVAGGDIVRALVLADKAGGDYVGGDLRRLNVTPKVPKDWFVPHQNYNNGDKRMAHSLRVSDGKLLTGLVSNTGSTPGGNLVPGIRWMNRYGENLDNRPVVGSHINGVHASKTGATSDPPGDWNNGFGNTPDGAYLNKADEGVAYSNKQWENQNQAPYFGYDGTTLSKFLTSPNKQIPSPVMFGSLPAGTEQGYSWRTLLFRPDPTGKHGGADSPPDHLLLDLFWMPVVEPYAISEPLSTAGKINMNTQILPFSYITRETGLHAVLASERMLTLPGKPNDQTYIKSLWKEDWGRVSDQRFKLNITETLKGFRERFNKNDIFRSASEIATLDLIPDDPSSTDDAFGKMGDYWDKHQLTGDNVRERPYATIYPRLTTKSNTFTVHFIAQALKKIPSTAPETWSLDKDVVESEFRGSVMIERYIDPADPELAATDFAANAASETVERLYRWRVTNFKRFDP